MNIVYKSNTNPITGYAVIENIKIDHQIHKITASDSTVMSGPIFSILSLIFLISILATSFLATSCLILHTVSSQNPFWCTIPSSRIFMVLSGFTLYCYRIWPSSNPQPPKWWPTMPLSVMDFSWMVSWNTSLEKELRTTIENIRIMNQSDQPYTMVYIFCRPDYQHSQGFLWRQNVC